MAKFFEKARKSFYGGKNYQNKKPIKERPRPIDKEKPMKKIVLQKKIITKHSLKRIRRNRGEV